MCYVIFLLGLKVFTNQQKPCEAAHEIMLSLEQPKTMKQLTLSFPYPFLVNNVRATLRRKDRSIDLVLTKALFEPWPCEFQTKHKKFVVDSLKPWEESKTNSFALHLGMQFSFSPQPSQLRNPVLDEVREMIKSIFVNVTTKYKHDFFICIQRKGSERPDWYLRFHRPLRTFSNGSPVLMLSALDETLAESLRDQGKQNLDANVKDVRRIFVNHSTGDNVTLWFTDPRVIQLWRFVLRLNSTKTVPSSWQTNNLPLGDNSPCLATFISPLYASTKVLDAEVDAFDVDKLTMSAGSVEEQNYCAGCQQNPLNPKRCSRCRVVIYCSVECQRQHWPQHKIVCTSK